MACRGVGALHRDEYISGSKWTKSQLAHLVQFYTSESEHAKQ